MTEEELRTRIPGSFLMAGLEQRPSSLFTQSLIRELYEAVTGLRLDIQNHRTPDDLKPLKQRLTEAFRHDELVAIRTRPDAGSGGGQSPQGQRPGGPGETGPFGALVSPNAPSQEPAGVSFTLRAAGSGRPLASQRYQIIGAQGQVLAQGITDKNGHTAPLEVKEAQEVTLHLLPAQSPPSSSA